MANITKIYEIKLTGQKELVANMQLVNKSFENAKKRFTELKSQLANGGLNAIEIKAIKTEMEQVRLEILKLRKENLELTNEGKAYTNTVRIQREEERKANNERKASFTEYQKLSRELTELRNRAKEVAVVFGVESQEFRQAASEANKLDIQLKKIDASLGQFQRNVGNYPKTINIGGISQSTFNQLNASGLGDVLGNQVDRVRERVRALDDEFLELKNRIRQARESGTGDLNGIENEIIQNRIEADRFNNEIRQSTTHLNGLGGVGTGVFGRMRTDIKQLILGFVGIQAAMGTVSTLISKATEFDSVNTAIKAVSKETGDFEQNQRFLESTTERLGLKLLDTSNSFKIFFAASTQSGISADETRKIFESASEASAVMKLTQEQTNGVMLAFGQIASKGKVQAEELRGQIGERIPGAFGIAAKAMGVTTAELDKMMKDGKLLSNEFLPKFAEELKKTYSAGQEPVKGVRAEWNRLDNTFSKIANNKTFVNTISLMISLVGGLTQLILGIPFPLWILGITTLSAYYISLNSQIILNKIATIQATVATNTQNTSTRLLASANLILSNNLKIARSGFQLLFATIKGNPIVALILIVAGLVLWLGKLVSKNTDVQKSFARLQNVLSKLEPSIQLVISIFSKFTTEIAQRLAPILIKIINQLFIPLAEKYLPVLSHRIRVVAGTINVLVGEFFNAINVGSEFAKTFKLIWEAITERDFSKLKQAAKNQVDILVNGYKDTKERILRNFNEGFSDINKVNDNNKGKGEGRGGGGGVFKEYSANPADAKLTGEQKDYLKELENKRDRELAINEELYTKGEKNERDYLTKVRDLNIDFYDKKIAHLKGKNTEELKEKSQTSLLKVKIEKETNDKLFEIDKLSAEKSLEQAKNNAQEKLNLVTDDQNSTSVQRSEAEQVYYQSVIEAQIKFNTEMDKLEKDYNKNSKDNVEKRNEDLISSQSDLNKTLFKLIEERFKQNNDIINNSVDFQENKIKIEAESKKQEILRDKKLSNKQKEIELNKIIAINEIQITQSELARVDALIKSYELKKATNSLNEEEVKQLDELILKYAELNTGLIEKQNNFTKIGQQQLLLPSDSTTQNIIKDNIIESFSLDESEVGNLLGNVIAGSYDLANQAMNNYYDAERNRVEKSKQLAYERIDLEKQQLLNSAQSAAERESIEKQAAEKKKQADKEAGEKLKKIKKQELKIALATELANIGVAAAIASASYGPAAPIMLPILYGMMALLAIGRYAINVKSVDSAQYGRGGKLTGPSHSKNNGMPVVNPDTGETQAYLEGDEGIINKRSMNDGNVYSVTGTPSQIASKINTIGGGVEFAGGASLKKYLNGGPYLGSNLQPPVFRSYYENRSILNTEYNNNNSLEIQEVKELLIETNKTLAREVSRKTIISSREMSVVQKENYKQSEIATL